MTDPEPNRSHAYSLTGKLMLYTLGAGIVMLGLAGFALYVIRTHVGKQADNAPVNIASASPDCANAAANYSKLNALAKGEVAAMSIAKTPGLVPALIFNGPDGQPTSLASFKGKTVLLNLWATWCVPCRLEMPALDQLQAKMGGDDFAVIAVNIDTTRLEKPKQFFVETKLTHLPFYADPKANIFETLRTPNDLTGLPDTLLIDKKGCQIGIIAGPAKWDSPDAVALLTAAKGA